MQTQHDKLDSDPTRAPSAHQPIALTTAEIEVISGGEVSELPPPVPAQPGLQPGPQPGW